MMGILSPTTQSLHSSNQSYDFFDNQPNIFARHETFHPRYGWLKKGFDLAVNDTEVFSRDDAPVVFGVGKNMVKSIRYWCYAFKILEECQTQRGRAREYNPTHFGRALLGEQGWDPYLEDPASLWLLHWFLLKAPSYATAWSYAFSIFYKHTFVAEDLLSAMNDFIEQSGLTHKPNQSSLGKDINCLLRMYVTSNDKTALKEDSLDCPFGELGLITSNDEGKFYSFNIGDKSNLPSSIIVAACLDYVTGIGHTAKTIALSRLCYDVGSPGQAFKITTDSIYHAIEQVAEHEKGLSLSDTAGLIQLSFHKEPEVLFNKVLSSYYSKGI